MQHTAGVLENDKTAGKRDPERVAFPSLAEEKVTLRGFSNLDQLEAEAAYILLEAAASLERTGLLFSAGKDSDCIAYVAHHVFNNSGQSKGGIPFPFLFFDSGENFPELISYRDKLAKDLGVQVISFNVDEYYQRDIISAAPNDNGSVASILELIKYAQKSLDLQGLIGGGRRDEDGARAKERKVSVREADGVWRPESQRPELWENLNYNVPEGGHVRIFPLSNWTEVTVWEYISRENVPLPSLYYAHEREVFSRDGKLFAYFPDTQLLPGEKVETKMVRCRTIGDRHTTGFIESNAKTAEQVLREILTAEYSERAGRAEDQTKGTGMEARKTQGWF